MKLKIFVRAASILLALLCITGLSAYAAEGTEGDELQIAEAAQLEIQLGTVWAGVEFSLRTDAGLYPAAIPVGDDGVLRLEIGGSKSYTLSCLQSDIAIPEKGTAPVIFELASESEQLNPAEQEESAANTIAGIPVKHLIIFIGGIFLAVAVLILLRISAKRRGEVSGSDYDDDDE